MRQVRISLFRPGRPQTRSILAVPRPGLDPLRKSALLRSARIARGRVLRGLILGLVLAASATVAGAQGAAVPDEMARLRAEASAVTIVRDDWGIAHVHGHTDAD